MKRPANAARNDWKPHASLAYIKRAYEWNWAGAERELRDLLPD
jgi:hypothetical protein